MFFDVVVSLGGLVKIFSNPFPHNLHKTYKNIKSQAFLKVGEICLGFNLNSDQITQPISITAFVPKEPAHWS